MRRWTGTARRATALRRVALVGAAAVPLVLAGAPTAGAQTSQAQTTQARAATAGWTQTSPVIPTGVTGASFSQVACPARNSCFAIGYTDGRHGTAPLAEHWNGTAWALQDIALPAGSSDGVLTSLSCPTPRDCIAVGDYIKGIDVTLAERWNGTSWVTLKTPNPSDVQPAALYLVSCASATSCLALAPDLDGDGPFAETYNGKAWTMLTPAFPAGEIDALSCTSATSCIAVGIASSTSALAASWDGSTWTTQPTPALTRAALGAIWCGSATDCVATGEYKSKRPLMESWNGTAWTQMPSQRTSGLESVDLGGVSCTAGGGTCTAVGFQIPSTPPKTGSTFAEHWNGTRWLVQPTVNPSGARNSGLGSVSCFTAAECTAVGNYTDSTRHVLPLAEQGS
jgi:hypothetical protein